MRDPRHEFPEPVRRHLARAAGETCSRPTCRARTCGASEDGAAIRNVGVAAHIHAAASKGPRFDPALPVEAVRAAENGIWLCATCAVEIDQHAGRDFPAEVLRAWKLDHEREVREAIGRPASETTVAGAISASGIGVVTGLEITRPNVRIAPGTTVNANGVGRITGMKI